MPFFLFIAVVQIGLIVHAAKTGRFSPWGYILFFLPVAGAVAYVVVELVPEWFGSPHGQRARGRVVNTLDPERRYRELVDQLDVADTISRRGALAEECVELGKYWAALEHYDEILKRPMGDEPIYMLGRARAEFGLGRFQETVVTLEELRQKWPDYQSAEGHLLYARALEESGRREEALDEYGAVSHYFPGAEARVRCALLLQKVGRDTEAKTLLTEVLAQMRRAPRYVRKAQAEWIAMAERAMRG